MLRSLPTVLLLPLLVLLFPCGTQAQDFGRRERWTDVLHYDIRIVPDHAAASVQGDVRIIAVSLRDTLHSVRLDAVRMRIDSVFMNGFVTDFRYDSLSLDVRFHRPVGYGDSIALRIVYACTPYKGMYFIRPDASFPNDPWQIWTQGQGEDNRHWLPCYDFPNDKATSELRATVDSGRITLSNGRLLSRTPHPDGRVTWHWLQDKPHSSYLIMFAAGKYHVYTDSARGIPVQSYHYQSDRQEDVARTYASSADMLEFFSDFIGVPYPWDKYAQIPVAHYLYGGMENTSATVLADTRAVVDARAAVDYDPEPLIAHELAHQWWGDLVTYIDWNNEWLNEGFATYYQQRWTLHRHGKDDFDVQRYEGIHNYMDWADKAGRLPVVYRRGTSAANTYSKGAAVLHMLNDILGEEQYHRVMKEYLLRYAYSNAETNDLKRVIEDVAGMNLHWFFSQWLYRAGYPELTVRSWWDEQKQALMVQVRQVQQIDTLGGRFRFPLAFHAIDRDGQLTYLRADVMGADTVFHFALGAAPLRVEVDPDNILCGRIQIEHGVTDAIRALQSSGSVVIRLRMVAELASHAGTDTDAFDALAHCARTDAHRAVRKAAVVACVDAASPSGGRTDFLKKLFLDVSKDVHSGVRALAYHGFRKLRDVSLREVFEGGMRDSSYYVEAAAMNCLLDGDTTNGWSVIRQRLRSRSHMDILALAALDWVRHFPGQEALREVRALAGPGHSLALRAKAFETLLSLGDDAQSVRALVEGMLAEPRYQIRLYAVSALAVFGRAEAQRRAMAHLTTESDPRVRDRIRQLYATGGSQ
ncbi:MAG: M1 family metallopeptidase [Bacteroidia bacterium]|nr:M1 family metallopeptidase [Bacteroidia bacterium]